LDKQQKGYLTREDFLRIPELAINPLGDRIVHAFFRDSKSGTGANGTDGNSAAVETGDTEVVNFCDFVRVLAHFRPIKKNIEKNKLNGREEKLKCKSK
jgi:calcineurin B family protein 1